MSDPVVLMDAKYDRLFKDIITDEWCVKSDGHVESPQGYFAIVEIPEHPGELTDMGDACGWSEFEEVPPSGWYFTIEDNSGMIRVYKTTKARAEAMFAESEAGFAMWEAY